MGPAAPFPETVGGRTQAAPYTLLELVTQLDRASRSEEETVQTVLALLEAGRARLTGSFLGCRPCVFATREDER